MDIFTQVMLYKDKKIDYKELIKWRFLMKIEQLQLINRNDTVDILLKIFVSSQEISNQTNLDSFNNFLKKKGNYIDDKLFFNFFKELQDSGVGFLTNYNGQRFTKFLWNYSLKDVSEQILFPNKMVKIRPTLEEELEEVKDEVIPEGENMDKPKRRGRPKGSRNLSRQPIQSTVEEVREKVEAATPKSGRPKAGLIKYGQRISKDVVFMFTTSKGEFVPFELKDAERLLQQVEQIKSQLN